MIMAANSPIVPRNAEKLIFAVQVVKYYFLGKYPEMMDEFDNLSLVKEARRYSEFVSVRMTKLHEDIMVAYRDPSLLIREIPLGMGTEDISSWIDCFNSCTLAFKEGLHPKIYFYAAINLAVKAVIFFHHGVPETLNTAIFAIASDLSKKSMDDVASGLYNAVKLENTTYSTSPSDDRQPYYMSVPFPDMSPETSPYPYVSGLYPAVRLGDKTDSPSTGDDSRPMSRQETSASTYASGLDNAARLGDETDSLSTGDDSRPMSRQETSALTYASGFDAAARLGDETNFPSIGYDSQPMSKQETSASTYASGFDAAARLGDETDFPSIGGDNRPLSKQETSAQTYASVVSTTAGTCGLKKGSTSSDSDKSCSSPSRGCAEGNL